MTEDFRPVQLRLSPIEEKIFDLSQAQPIYPRPHRIPFIPPAAFANVQKQEDRCPPVFGVCFSMIH
jgi:hypothetical protein